LQRWHLPHVSRHAQHSTSAINHDITAIVRFHGRLVAADSFLHPQFLSSDSSHFIIQELSSSLTGSITSINNRQKDEFCIGCTKEHHLRRMGDRTPRLSMSIANDDS
jgi:hypothetical protein